MALGYTLHSVLRGKQELPIGTVVEFSEKDHADLLRFGAIREPSEAELQLYGLASGQAAEPAESKAPKKSSRKADEKDKDPEVEAGDLDI